MGTDNDTKELPAEEGSSVYLPEAQETQKNGSKFQKTYVLYCAMTLSIMLFTLAFAASELFGMFFSEGDIGQMVMSKLFGADAAPNKSFGEIMLDQSFVDLSLGKESATNKNDSTSEKSSDDTGDTTSDTSGTSNTEPESPDTGKPDTEPEDIYEYFPEKILNGMNGIIPLDLSLPGYGNGYIYNQSSLSPDMNKLKDISVSTSLNGIYPSGAPLVLIIHTHGTEAYTEEGSFWYDPSKEISRSSDTSKNVVYIGKIISDALNSAGISTLHCEIMHDADSYSGSYDRSCETIKKYLSEYPTIQYVIDIHRDAIVRSTGELVSPVIPTEKGSAAQVMCVVGGGSEASRVYNWERNLALAQKLREELNSENEGICRPSCLRDSSYNQQYAPYSLLIEMGAAGNTLKEAEISAKEVAKALVKVIAE